MDRHVFQTKALRDPRLAAHAIAGRGAWLFARDDATLLWTNATGAALFNLADPHADFTPNDDMREEIARLAARLSQTGTARLERLYGFGAAFGQRTTCTCARLTFSNGTIGILIVAMTTDARTLPLAKRFAWLVEGIAEPVAIFDVDGALTAATQTRARLSAPQRAWERWASTMRAMRWTRTDGLSGHRAGQNQAIPVGRWG